MSDQEEDVISGDKKYMVSIMFTLPELWLMNDSIRDARLSPEIGLAINACTRHDLESFALVLDAGMLITVDYLMSRAMNTPEGASGLEILLKIFRGYEWIANSRLGITEADKQNDYTYIEAVGQKEITNAEPESKPEPDPKPKSTRDRAKPRKRAKPRPRPVSGSDLSATEA